MNSSGWIRGMMAKSMEEEKFLTHVVSTILGQLHVWDEQYNVKVLEDLLGKEAYFILVNKGDNTYKVTVEKTDIQRLKNAWPYALDQHIWKSLQGEGLIMEKSAGNYLEKCAV